MDLLPSYEEATTGLDWLVLVAPYVPARDWSRCCLVNLNFYVHFAPRLWLDPLVTVRELGLHPNDGKYLVWYRNFVNRRMPSVRLTTRALVRSLDFRSFATTASGLYSTEASERAISESFRDVPRIFPGLLCLLLDGHHELDPGSLLRNSGKIPVEGVQHSLQLLDLARCPYELSAKIFMSNYLRDLVYLDVSFVPGSVKTAAQTSLNPQHLPELRVLRVQGREMDDATAAILLQAFGRRLWSLDMSQNNLTDVTIDCLIKTSFSSKSFHSDAHFQTEGKLSRPHGISSTAQGAFDIIEESDFSAIYGHPDSFVADAPTYSRRADQTDLQEWQVVRADGSARERQDSAGDIKRLLLSDALGSVSSSSDDLHYSTRSSKGGLTHLYLNGNRFTSAGIARLLRRSSGRIEHIEFDNPLFGPFGTQAQKVSPLPVQIHAIFGLSHLFRPVIASSLRSIRTHHSLVTHIPTLKAKGLSARAACFLAEGIIRNRIAMAYPQPFIPNMNPRITSITLTNIPARSAGPLIDEILTFLDQASAQQEAIDEARAIFNRRGPSVLNGLRHIRLELDPDHSTDSPSMAVGANINAEALLDPANDGLNVPSDGVDGEPWDITSRGPGSNRYGQNSTKTSGRIPSPAAPLVFSHASITGEHVPYRVDPKDTLDGNGLSLPVWVGTGKTGPHPAVNEYMKNLQDLRLHTDVGPASPGHVLAGVPWGSQIFHAAWDAMTFPKRLPRIDGDRELGRMRDVAAAIKSYRLGTRGKPGHWRGKLELVRASAEERYHSSYYWR